MSVQFFQPATVKQNHRGAIVADAARARAFASSTDLVVHGRIGRSPLRNDRPSRTVPGARCHHHDIQGAPCRHGEHNAVEHHTAIRRGGPRFRASAIVWLALPHPPHEDVGGNLSR